MTESVVSPTLNAWLALHPREKAAAEPNFSAIRRKVDPTHEDYDPNVSQRELAGESGMSVAKICRLLKRWDEGVTDRSGKLVIPPECKAALAPQRPGPPQGRPFLDPAKAEEILDAAAKFMRRSGNPNRVPVTPVYKELVAKEELTGVKAPGFAQVRAALHRVPYQMRLTWAGGIEYLKKHGGMPRMMVEEPETPNIIWIFDQWLTHNYVILPDGSLVRLSIMTIIDAFGGGPILNLEAHRRLTAFTTAEALIGAILKHGKPAMVRCDSGKENKGPARRGCAASGIEMKLTTPRDPSVKGLVEQVHSNYDRFSRTLPYYAPPTIKNKPLRDEPPLTEAEFIKRLEAYAYGQYNVDPYTGQHARGRQSRLEIRQAAKFTPIIPAEDELRILFAEAKLVTVWSQGIRLHGLTYTNPKLATMIREKVWARQGRKDVEVIIHDQQMRFVCVARNALAEAAGMNDETRREYTTDRRTLAKAMATRADERIARARSKPDWLLQRAQQRLREQDQTPPRPAVRQITPVTGQTPAIAQAGSGGRLKLFRHQR